MIARDKLSHIGAGAAGAAVALACGASCVEALAVAAAGGVLKECYDWTDNRHRESHGQAPRHGVEAWDAIATLAGGAAVTALAWIGRHVLG